MLRLLALLTIAGAVLAQGQQVRVRLAERRTATTQPRVLFPQFPLRVQAARPAGAPEIAGLSPAARYAVVRLGGRPLTLAFDAPPGALALGLLYPGTARSAVGKARAGAQRGLLVDFEDVPAGGLHIDVRLQYEGLRLVRAGLQPSRHRRGRVTIGGTPREIILIDAEGDGAYDGADDRWIALKPERLKAVTALSKPDAFLLKEPQIPFDRDGQTLMVDDVARDGSSLLLRLGRPSMRAGEVLDRRYGEVRAKFYARFQRERESFRRRNEIDGKRRRTLTPVPWLNVPLSDARPTAKRERKPLLAFFFTESNPWCFRYDYYTFPDAEVDALLRKFVLVRIDAEKDGERSYAKSGARGMPCLMPLTAGGEPIRFRLCNRDPAGKVGDFKQEERMITGWQRPQELVVNLKRILEVAGQ